MKIQSHNIEMASQHVAYKSMLESSFSFETFITDAPVAENLNRFDYDKSRTINDIIQNLMAMLKRKTQSDVPSEENMVGYSKFSYSERYEEHENLDFSTKGQIKTDKGSIDFDLNFSMSRSFVVENRIDIYSAFDPLIINLDGDIPELGASTFSFDLDNDGECDQVSCLKEGNGFLAYDKNEDGKVNQGSELFGTKSGDGFAELAEYDEDHNSWIDENDSIFNKLQIWLKNEDTKEKELVGLGEVGIGAIFLDSASSEFTYKTAQNDILGKMKSAGIFLNEDGSVGSIAEVDFNISKEEDHPLAQLLQA